MAARAPIASNGVAPGPWVTTGLSARGLVTCPQWPAQARGHPRPAAAGGGQAARRHDHHPPTGVRRGTGVTSTWTGEGVATIFCAADRMHHRVHRHPHRPARESLRSPESIRQHIHEQFAACAESVAIGVAAHLALSNTLVDEYIDPARKTLVPQGGAQGGD